jgi:uncharacterized MAPEG superfamily protein
MTTPLWVLLAFAGWTLLLLLGTVGVYRWSRILTGRAAITEFPADAPHGTAMYRRAMRAHANCVENLPVYGAIALCAAVTAVHSASLDALAIALILARVAQSVVHVAFAETKLTVAVRFSFFFAQLVCMVAMGTLVATAAAEASGATAHATNASLRSQSSLRDR